MKVRRWAGYLALALCFGVVGSASCWCLTGRASRVYVGAWRLAATRHGAGQLIPFEEATQRALDSAHQGGAPLLTLALGLELRPDGTGKWLGAGGLGGEPQTPLSGDVAWHTTPNGGIVVRPARRAGQELRGSVCSDGRLTLRTASLTMEFVRDDGAIGSESQ